jgi:RHS repeat-associated protein
VFYRGTSAVAGQELARMPVTALGAGETATIITALLDPTLLGEGEVLAALETDPQATECETANNRASGRVLGLTVSDHGGLIGRQTWVLPVTERPQFPSLSGQPPATAQEGQPYHYTPQFNSPHVGDALQFYFLDAPAGASIDPNTGQVRWTPAWGQVGSFTFLVEGRNLYNFPLTHAWTVTVSASSAANTAPQFTSTPVTAVSLGDTYRYRAQAVDAEGHAIRYSLSTPPAGVRIDTETGQIQWTPASATPDRVDVTVTATDARGGSATQAFTIRLYATPNQPPVFSSTPGLSASVDTPYQYLPQASDPDGDPLTLVWTTRPTGANVGTLDEINWIPAAAQVGEQDFVIEARDDRGGIAGQVFSVAVSAPNAAPQISSTPPATANIGEAYTYAVIAHDADGDTLTYALTEKPTGLQIDAQTGVIGWTPLAGQTGNHPVSLTVSDGRGGSATQSYALQVHSGTPVITSTPPTTAKAGRVYRYAVIATDPDNDTLVYALSEAPQGMTIDSATGAITWMPAVASTTPIRVRVRVSDGTQWVEQGWNLTALDASVPFTVDISVDPSAAAPGGPLDVTVAITGASGAITLTATLDGDPLTLSPNSTTTLTAPTTPGIHTIQVTSNDGTQTVTTTTTFGVADPNDTDPPVVQILSPAAHSEITMPVAVRATVQDIALHRWTLHLRPAHSSDPAQLLASGTNTVTDAVIGQLDPTLLMNDQYELLLQAQDTSGRWSSHAVVVLVTGEMKVGHFSITLEEVNLPFAGIPIRVTRTYDTRRRNEPLDFGPGWSIDYQNVRLRESQAPGYGWTLQQIGSGLSTRYCVRPNGPRIVTVTLPDGDVETFEAKAHPECSDMVATLDVELRFVPVGDTHSALRQDDHSNVRIGEIAGSSNTHLFDLGNPDVPVDPSHYTLTTAEGVIYTLNQGFGVEKITDPHGNTLTYSEAGIVHSTGAAIGFTRDTLGRITRITLPDETYLDYHYDAAGDLVESTDALRQPTTYAYYANKPHFLKDYTDARGIRVLRNEYDDEGRLTATIDADNQRVEYTHDIPGRTERVRNRRGHATLYSYNDAGHVLSETNALGETTSHTYDPDGNELSRTDALDHTTQWTYDPRGNRLTETNALNHTQRWEYNPRNAMTKQYSAQTPSLVTLENTYLEPWGVLQHSRNALNEITQFRYDHGPLSFETGELRRITDATGAETIFGITRWGWSVQDTDAAGHAVHHETDIPTGRRLRSTTTRTHEGQTVNLVTAYTYDDKGRVTATTQPDGSVSTTTWNAIDRPVEECVQQRCTTYLYDNQGRLTKTTHPNGTWDAKVYDANGNVIAETDTDGRTTKFVFDAADRQIETIFPDDTPGTDTDNPRTRSVYDAAGRLEMVVDENGHITSYGYDAADRQISITNALNQTTTTQYDADGRRSQITDTAGRTTKFVYDLAGRLVETVHPDEGADDGNDANNPRTFADYDKAGRKIAERDEHGRAVRFAYDKLGRLIAVFLPDPVTGNNPPLNAVIGNELPSSPDSGVLVTRYAYDEAGNKLTQITPSCSSANGGSGGAGCAATSNSGVITTWTYDNAGRVLTRTLPLGQVETFQYDSLGRRSQHTDFRGHITGYTYHANTDWLAAIDYANQPDISLGYTPGGQLREVHDANGTTTYTRDTRNRLTQVTWPQRPGMTAAPTISYQYDAAGNRTRLTTPNQVLDYAYDNLNRLVTVTPQGATAPVAAYTYDEAGNRATLAYDNGSTTSYTYNRRNRLTGIRHKAGATLLLGIAYTLDPSGLRTGIHETGAINRQVSYTYDAVKRLTSESVIAASGDRRTSWVYDKTGNRLTQVQHIGPAGSETGSATTAYVYDANDRLTTETTTLTGSAPGSAAGQTTYTYDAAGNTIKKVAPDETLDYRYDDANRLAELETLAGEVTRYAYTHDGIRLSQTRDATSAAPTTTHYLIDPNQPYAQVIEESTQQGTSAPSLAAAYVIGDDRIRRYNPAVPATGGNPTIPAGLRYYHADGLGSTRLLTDEASAVTDHYAYHAFGEIDPSATQQSSDNTFLFTGEQLDPNSGFYYLRARHANPANGRFTQQDTFMGFDMRPVSLHKYLYGDADPPNKIDPSGYMSLSETSAAQNIQGNLVTLATRAGKLLNVYDRVNSLKDLTIGLVQLLNFVSGMTAVDLSSAWPASGSRVNFSDAAEAFVQESRKAIGTGIGNWAAGYVTSTTKGSKLTGYVIYMPTFGPLPSRTVGTGFKINGNEIKLGFGGPGGNFGSLAGIGVIMGSERQLYRMDYHPFNSGHGGSLGIKGHEIAVWQRNPYHFHVYNWNGGPR